MSRESKWRDSMVTRVVSHMPFSLYHPWCCKTRSYHALLSVRCVLYQHLYTFFIENQDWWRCDSLVWSMDWEGQRDDWSDSRWGWSDIYFSWVHIKNPTRSGPRDRWKTLCVIYNVHSMTSRVMLAIKNYIFFSSISHSFNESLDILR